MSNKILSILLVVMLIVTGVIGYFVIVEFNQYKSRTVIKEDTPIENVDTELVNEVVVVSNDDNLELSKYPENVRNGNMSVEFYEVMTNLYVEYFNYMMQIKSSFDDTENMIDLSEEYIAFVNSFSLGASTDLERNLVFYLVDLSSNSEAVANSIITYINGNEFSKQLSLSYMDETIATMGILDKMLLSYGLYDDIGKRLDLGD